MSRRKSNTKSGWKKKNNIYRLAQNAKAKVNRENRIAHLAASDLSVTLVEGDILAES